jgi:hypothetical protein
MPVIPAMLLTGNDRLAGWSIWFFLFAVVHAAHLVRGAFGVLAELVLAALLALVVGRILPENDDGRRLPRSASMAILMLAMVILMSVALGDALSSRATSVVGG